MGIVFAVTALTQKTICPNKLLWAAWRSQRWMKKNLSSVYQRHKVKTGIVCVI